MSTHCCSLLTLLRPTDSDYVTTSICIKMRMGRHVIVLRHFFFFAMTTDVRRKGVTEELCCTVFFVRLTAGEYVIWKPSRKWEQVL